MLFNSAVFLVFATAFFALWPAARRRPGVRYTYLVTAAAVFYGWWDWRFLFLLFVPGSSISSSCAPWRPPGRGRAALSSPAR